MVKLFFCCHGKMASGMKTSLDILVGDTKKLLVFDAYVNEEKVAEHVDAFYSTCREEDEKILISDIYGGSVNQILYQYAARDHTMLITGINLPLLLEIVVAANNEHLTKENLKQFIEQAKDSIKLIEVNDEEMADEEFF